MRGDRGARGRRAGGGGGRARTPWWASPLVLALAAGCPYISDEQAFERADLDDDGHAWPDDCGEGDAAVHPGAEERCNGADDDCDGAVDEDATDALVWYVDDDADGFGGSGTAMSCDGGAGLTLTPGDCDDAAGDVNPDADERCNNGVDDDCDGGPNDCPLVDEHVVDDVADGSLSGSSGSGLGLAAVGGDLDGDGAGDLVIGEPYALSGGGRALVWYGPIGAGDLGAPHAELQGQGSASLGLASGDLDDDGADDLLVGAPTRTVTLGGTSFTNSGEVYLLSGGARLEGAIALDGYRFGQGAVERRLGRAIAVLHDGAGPRVAVVEGGSWSGTSGDLRLLGVDGAQLANAGGATSSLHAAVAIDTDGDGVDEVYVSSPSNSDTGASYAGIVWGLPGDVSGGFALADAPVTFAPPGAEAYFGWALAGADLDGDGRGDLLVGAPMAALEGQRGAVYGYTAPSGTGITVDAAALRIAATTADSLLGYGVAGGDFDGDGADDLLVAAPAWSEADDGRVALFYGPRSGLVTDVDADAALVGGPSSALVGLGVAGVGDPSGDGVPDLTIAGYDADGAPHVHLLFGRGL